MLGFCLNMHSSYLKNMINNGCYNGSLWSHYRYHKKGFVLILWSQRQHDKPRIKKMLQNCSTNNGGVQKVSGANETNASYNS